jgi:hypothetical protein
MAYGNYAPFYRPGYFNPMQAPQMPNMAENQNQFAQPYQAPMQTPVQPMPTPTPSNDMIWVLGQTEAESYPVAPNATVTMWDKNRDTVYIKSVNAQGVPSIEILDYTKRSLNPSKMPEEHVCKCGDNFVTKEEFKALQSKYDEIMGKLQALEEKPKSKDSKLTKGDDE